jgi:GDPmannose 4,6-dehydratase
MPRALVTGISGQDGWYLSELLLAEGFEVFGLVRADEPQEVHPGVSLLVGDVRDEESIIRAIRAATPDELYNLAALSSVAQSWAQPTMVADVNALGVLRILNAVRSLGKNGAPPCRIVHAGSGEIFGRAPAPHSESTPIAPVTPYGAAKAFAQQMISIYRSTGMWVGSAILYNHESPRRPTQFVTRKITSTVARIAAGSTEQLHLGNLDARRDWGYARDYMRAMMLIARHHEPDDFVIASGVSHSVSDFVSAAFACVGIDDWQRHVTVDHAFQRPVDAADQRGDPGRARERLGWEPSVTFDELVEAMVAADVADLSQDR